MKEEYITPQILVLSVGMTTVIAASMYLGRDVVTNIDELAVKDNAWGDIWDEEYDYCD